MPDAGQTTDNALVGSWYVKVGEFVKRGEVLLDIETDKAVLPVESFAEGTVLELKFEEGDQVNAGDVLALIGDKADLDKQKEEMSADPSKVENKTVVEASSRKENTVIIHENIEPLNQGSINDQDVKAMPNAKKLARDANLDLNRVTASNGEYIKASDVETFLPEEAENKNLQYYSIFPLSNIRSAIGRRMVESVRNIPTFSATIKVNMARAIVLKEQILNDYEIKISYNDLFVKALSVTAKKYPLINSRFEEEEVRVYQHSHIGLAVSIETGLVVPVVRDVDLLNLGEIANINRNNIERARAGKLLPDDMEGGTMTLSNLGMFEISQFDAIINPPESSIYAVGKIENSPIWIDDGWVPVPLMTITGTFDHRLIDGAYGAQVLQSVKRLIEMPSLMLL